MKGYMRARRTSLPPFRRAEAQCSIKILQTLQLKEPTQNLTKLTKKKPYTITF